MKARNINEVVHEWCLEILTDQDCVIDATAGNGFDTLFLSEHAKWVYAFDVSELAISRTREKTKHQTNITLIHDSHEFINNHVKEKVHGIMYNCGYLPKSDHRSVTQASSTIASLNQAKRQLTSNGWICMTVYVGHKGGAEEASRVESWLKENTRIEKRYTYPGIEDAPIAYFCRIL